MIDTLNYPYIAISKKDNPELDKIKYTPLDMESLKDSFKTDIYILQKKGLIVKYGLFPFPSAVLDLPSKDIVLVTLDENIMEEVLDQYPEWLD